MKKSVIIPIVAIVLKTVIIPMVAIVLLVLVIGYLIQAKQSNAPQVNVNRVSNVQQKPQMRYFLFSSRPNAQAWKMMKKNPEDRQAATAAAMKKSGCEMLAYYWGLDNGRNYIIVAAPDNKTVQALLVQQLSGGLVYEYEVIELVRSSDILAMFERLKEIEAADDTLK